MLGIGFVTGHRIPNEYAPFIPSYPYDDIAIFAMLGAFIALFFSLLHYKSRESVYKTWLYTTAIASVLLVGVILMYVVDPPGSAGAVSLAGVEFALLGIAYVGASFVIWLYGFLTRKRNRK